MALVASFDWLKKLGLKADLGGMTRSFYDRGEIPKSCACVVLLLVPW